MPCPPANTVPPQRTRACQSRCGIWNHRDGNDDYTQPGNLFRLFSAEQRQRLFDNIAAAMHGVPDEIKRRQVALFAKCDPAYGAGVARALKLDRPGEDRLKGTRAAAT